MTILTRFAARWWAVIAVIAVWQLAVWLFDVNAFLIPGPISIAAEIAAEFPSYLIPLVLTLRTAAIGFLLGVGVGYLMASVTWIWPVFGTVLTPFALVIRSVPFVALIPVLTRILGFGATTAWIITAMVCFFPTFVLVTTGLRDVPGNSSDVFAANGASRLDRYRLLAVPSSLPALATSIRIAAASSFAAALIAEFLMGTEGLALVLSKSLASLDMTQLWGAAVCAIVLSIIAYLLANRYETHIVRRWR